MTEIASRGPALRHDRVTKKMTIMVSPTFRRIHHLQRELNGEKDPSRPHSSDPFHYISDEAVLPITLEIPLLSSFSSPIRVLNIIYPET